MAITNANITASATTIYTSTGNTVVSTLHLCNTDSAAKTVDLYLVPSGQTATASRQIYKSLTIPANDTYVISTERFVLGNGDFISATANVTNTVIATISYASV